MSGRHHYILTLDELADLFDQSKDDILEFLGTEALIKMPGGKKGILPQTVRSYLSEKGVDYAFKVVAYVNLKGGTGKTTSTISAATRAVQYGFRTCILDMDAQANATLAFDMMPQEEDPVFYDIWQNPEEMTMGSLKEIEEGLCILPSSLENSLLDVNLMNPAAQKRAVRGVCETIGSHGFHLVMIDCPPSLGTAVISTICAADIVVIPVCSDAFSLKGLEFTLAEIESICQTFHIEPPQVKILYTKFDRRLNISSSAHEFFSSRYPEHFIPFPIRISSEFSNTLEKKRTVFAAAGKGRARTDYDRYVRYLLNIEDTV